MATKRLFVGGFRNGAGIKIVDPLTGVLVGQQYGDWHTDSIIDIITSGGSVWALDSDSSLARYSLEGAVQSKVDIGYYGTADTSSGPEHTIHVEGQHIYYLHKWNSSNPFPNGGGTQGEVAPADSDVHYLVKRDKDTLALVSEVKLNHANLFDSGGNSSYVNNYIPCWQSDGFWVYANGGAKSGFFLKVSYLGVPTGDEIDTNSVGGLSSFQFALSSTKLINVNTDNYTGDFGSNHSNSIVLRAVDFVAKTLTTYSYSLTPSQQINNIFNYTRNGEHTIGVSGDVITIIVQASNYSWISGPYTGQTGAFFSMSFDITDGTSFTMTTTPVGLEQFDRPFSVSNNLVSGFNVSGWVTAQRFFMWDSRSGVWLVNFSTGAVEYTSGFGNFMQGYSSDATEVYTGEMFTVDYYTLSGSINEGGNPVARELWIYDQTTGHYIGRTTSSGIDGTFSFEVYSQTPKFIVCPSSTDTENFKITAYVLPV